MTTFEEGKRWAFWETSWVLAGKRSYEFSFFPDQIPLEHCFLASNIVCRPGTLFQGFLKPHLPEMPYLQEIVTALESLIAEAKGLDTQQETARAQFQDLVHRRQQVEKQGQTLRRRAESHL